jgi:hypothetical protein
MAVRHSSVFVDIDDRITRHADLQADRQRSYRVACSVVRSRIVATSVADCQPDSDAPQQRRSASGIPRPGALTPRGSHSSVSITRSIGAVPIDEIVSPVSDATAENARRPRLIRTVRALGVWCRHIVHVDADVELDGGRRPNPLVNIAPSDASQS